MSNITNSYDKSKYSAFTYTDDGHEYDSGLEARFGIVANHYDFVDLSHNNCRLMFIGIPAGYKPDFRYSLSNNEEVWIDVKGWIVDKDGNVLERVQQIIEFAKKSIKHPRRKLTQFAIAMAKKIRLYTLNSISNPVNGKDYVDAAVYVCPACGHGYISALDDGECPYCHKQGKTVCVDFNTEGNRIYAQMSNWAKECGTTSHLTTTTEDEIFEEFQTKANEAGIDMETTRNYLPKFMTPYEYNGVFTPRAIYQEPRKDVNQYGTAKVPIALIATIDKQAQNYKARRSLLKELALLIKGTNQISKVIVLQRNEDGELSIFVADSKNNTYEIGDTYHCNKCGAGYVASHDNNDCPCCGHAQKD